MGIVFKGFDRALSRNVAIKVLDPMLANIGTARQRFAREARAMAAISHEHVVPVYAVDEHGELPYFVMEYVPGGTLENRLAKEGPLDVVEVVRVGLQIAQALEAAHRQGLVHRDIKPSNILLDKGIERVRVADFGLARAADDTTASCSGVVAGTPQYMAPEQVRGETCDAQSDLFSLGSVMYALCCGHSPFRGDTVYAIMQRIVHDEPRSLREQNPRVPRWLEEFIFGLLAKPKGERFATTTDVVRALEQELAFLQNPVSVNQPTRNWRTIKRHSVLNPWLRHRLALPGLAAVLAICIAAWQWWPTPVNDRSTPIDQEMGLANMPPPTVPLWEADRIQEVQRMAESIEAEWYSSSANPGFDPWTADIERLRHGIWQANDGKPGPWPND
jgi:serine/threonine-protein kinase